MTDDTPKVLEQSSDRPSKHDAEQQEARPTLSTQLLRALVVPLAGFYSRSKVLQRDSKEGGARITDSEKAALADAAEKLIAESHGLTRAWRTGGDTTIHVQRDKDGRWPEPSLAAIAEGLAAFGVLDQDAAQERRELELLRMETELERERLGAERARLELMTAQVRMGKGDPVALHQVEIQPQLVYRLQEARTAPTKKRIEAIESELQRQKLSLEQQGPQPQTQTQYAAMTQGQSQSKVVAIRKDQDAMQKASMQKASMQQASMEQQKPQSIWSQLLECFKVAFCDLIWSLLDLFCSNGRFDPSVLDDDDAGDQLQNVLFEFVCALLACIPNILCPPESPTCAPAPAACTFAVEESR